MIRKWSFPSAYLCRAQMNGATTCKVSLASSIIQLLCPKKWSRPLPMQDSSSIVYLTTALAYDNFDINFKSPEPTVEHPSSFVSVTSATAIPLFSVSNLDVLWCSQCYWEKDPRDLSPSVQPIKIDTKDFSDFHLHSSSKRAPGQKLSPLLTNYAWHIYYILVQQGKHFGFLSQHLVQLTPINQIPLHQTTQIPCWSMNIKESTPDGNIEVLESLLWQGGIGEPEDKKFDPKKEIWNFFWTSVHNSASEGIVNCTLDIRNDDVRLRK